jgi:hypothetical protein
MFYTELRNGLSLFVDGSTCRSAVDKDTPLATCICHICDGKLVKGEHVCIPGTWVAGLFVGLVKWHILCLEVFLVRLAT